MQLFSKIILFWHSSLTMHSSLSILILPFHFHPAQKFGKEPKFLSLKVFLGRYGAQAKSCYVFLIPYSNMIQEQPWKRESLINWKN